MIELRLIKHALALGRYRNFARAAESLHLTQPSLTRSIALLERELGVRLFDRTKHGVRSTAFGEVLLARGAALLEGESDVRREILLLAGLEAGTLRVGTGPQAADVSVGEAAARLLNKHPRLRMQIVADEPGEIAERVVAGQIDVGVGDPSAMGDLSRLRIEPLPEHPIYLACRPGHPLLRERNPTLEQVLQYPLAATVIPGALGRLAGRGGRSGHIDRATGHFTPAVQLNSQSIARRIAMGSDALVPGTAGSLAPLIASGALARIDFSVPELHTSYSIFTLAERSRAPATMAFIEELRAVEAEIVAQEASAASSPSRSPRSHRRRRVEA